MLIYAEAVNELSGGPDAEAYNQVNRIRTRAHATPFSGMNQDEFRSAVLEERARELAMKLTAVMIFSVGVSIWM